MAKCTKKLIDAEAAKAAIEMRLRFYQNQLHKLELRMGCDMSHVYHAEGLVNGMEAAGDIIDALPDASEKAIHAERIPVPPHLAEAQRRVDSIANAQYNACTTECIDGIWWAKGSGIVAGPQATEQDALLEVAENWWRTIPERITHIPKEDDDGEMH